MITPMPMGLLRSLIDQALYPPPNRPPPGVVICRGIIAQEFRSFFTNRLEFTHPLHKQYANPNHTYENEKPTRVSVERAIPEIPAQIPEHRGAELVPCAY